ncbi:hypothetical protein LEP1GSC044_1413 [Leptospira kirschneri serovar Grippotyphosa str. RM52]|nr:hypothetical protein LEP1GSC044_1413 [Leptospira kirschneri serovar Grippotyphosa str. RM52]
MWELILFLEFEKFLMWELILFLEFEKFLMWELSQIFPN